MYAGLTDMATKVSRSFSFIHLTVFHVSTAPKFLDYERMACDRANNRRSCRHLAHGIILTFCLSFAMGAGEATPSRHLSLLSLNCGCFVVYLFYIYSMSILGLHLCAKLGLL